MPSLVSRESGNEPMSRFWASASSSAETSSSRRRPISTSMPSMVSFRCPGETPAVITHGRWARLATRSLVMS